MQTRWLCEACNKTNVVEIEDGAGVYTAVYKIEDDHKQASPDCEQPIARIRIIVEDIK